MSKKLTLSVSEPLVAYAHKYSKKNNTSVSKLVEQFFMELQKKETIDLHSKTQSLYGIFEESPLPDKKEMRVQFFEKDIS